MNNSSEFPKTYDDKSWKAPVGIAIAVMLALAIANGYLMYRVSNLSTDLAATRADLAQMGRKLPPARPLRVRLSEGCARISKQPSRQLTTPPARFATKLAR